MSDDELQAALPREMYVDAAQWAVERDAVLYGEWYCVGRVDDLGVATPKRVVAVDVAGESVLVTSAEDGTLHAAYNVCRHRGSQLCAPGEPARDAGSLRCPYHSWTYALDGSLLKAPHATVDDTRAFSLHPVGVETWRGFVFVHLTPAQARPLAEQVEHAEATLANYGMGDLVTGQVLSYVVAANYKVLLENYNECYHCGPVHPELSRLVPSFAGGGSDLDWDQGIPHREGAWTFTMTGTTDRVAAGRTRRARADPAQGRPRLPEPDALRLGRPRRGVRAAPAVRGPHRGRLLAAVRARRGRGRRVRPERRR